VALVAAARDIPMMVISAGTSNHIAIDLGLERDDPASGPSGRVLARKLPARHDCGRWHRERDERVNISFLQRLPHGEVYGGQPGAAVTNT